MRTRSLFAVVLLAACTVAPPPPVAVPVAPPPQEPVAYGFTLEEEATILRLEDRREFDPAIARDWMANPNSLHRQRMVIALGRIGSHTFIDANGNGVKDPGEMQAGVELLAALISDPDPIVRMNAAFALGEIGDPAVVEPLFAFAHDANDARVVGEAVEALSKVAASVPIARFAEFTQKEEPEGIRDRAIRFLFRWKADDASALAAAALESPSTAIRREAAFALSRRAYAPARAKLELLVNDPDMPTRSYVVAAIGRIADKESLALLLAALTDPHPWVRSNALVAIAKIEAKDATAIERHEFAQDVLSIIAATEDADPGTRSSAIETLGWYARKSDVARLRLHEIAVNGSRSNREVAAGTIAKFFPESLHADDRDIEAAATPWTKVRILENLDPLNEASLVWYESYATDADMMVRANAIGKIDDKFVDAPKELALIRTALNDDDPIVRLSAIDRYSKTKSDPMETKVATLRASEERGRADKMNDARLGAIQALAEIDFPERAAFLRKLVADRDPVVRQIAAGLIETTLKESRPQYTPLPVDRPMTDYERIVEWARRPHTATIHMARGNIELFLATQDAPMTTWNFAQLAKRGYFDGTTFMRVVPNFVIQGGDPRNDQNGGPGYSIRDEINLERYTRGAVGMALSGPDTGGSQFFITHSPQPHLDGTYTIFGHVSEGMNSVVDQVERGDRVDTITIDEKAP